MESTAYRSAAASSSSEKWYYKVGSNKCGPIDASQLTAMLASGELGPDTRVWTKGMEKWCPACDTVLMEQIDDPKLSPVVVSLNTVEQPSPKRKTPWWIWLIVGILVVGILGAACFFLFFNKEAPEEVEQVAEAAPVITYSLADPVVFENEACAFLIDEIGEKGDFLELDVRCVNKTADVLSFAWNSTCINGSMFDPLWSVYVQGNSTLKSSITFPLGTLDSYNLLPAEEIKFILSVYNEDQFDKQQSESSKYIMYVGDTAYWEYYDDYKTVKGYDGYVFNKSVKVDADGRPYYVAEDKTNVYFDELYNAYGQPLYGTGTSSSNYERFYNDSFGRPYYFNEYGSTVYYDGYGFAFTDEESSKNYFYDENGDPAYYGNGGIPEYYEGTVSQTLLDAGKPENLAKANVNNIVHKEFCIYPTGKDADEVTYPNRVTSGSEQVYWKGEKGTFIVLGGKMDEFKGYIVYTYVENNSDSYIYFGASDVVVNGVSAYSELIAVLRPHSSTYQAVTIPADFLEDENIKNVEEINCRLYAVGENLSVPLYPITWDAATLSDLTK